MSMFHKLKASFGIGAAIVDTVIDKNKYEQGETVTGVVKVRGGKVKQRINRIDLSLYTTVVVEGEDGEYLEEYCLERMTVVENTEMEPEEAWDKPFSMDLPLRTPITNEEMKVWVRTEVNIARGADPVDVDPITVFPSNETKEFFRALNQLGFHLEKTKTIWRDSNENEVIQMFGFVPEDGPFFEELEALVLAVYPDEGGLKIVFEIDRYLSGFGGIFAEALDADKSKHAFKIEHRDLEGDTKNLSDQIEKWLRSAI